MKKKPMDNIALLISLIESHPEIYGYLKDCPYQILKCWTVLHFKKKQKIILQGDVCDDFFIIQDGLVDIVATSEDGKQYSHAIYKAGNYLGELEIFDRLVYCCSAVALTDVCVLEISRSAFLRWIEIDRNIASVLVRNVCSKFYTLSEKAASDTFYSLKYRLCEFLLGCIGQREYIDQTFRLKVDKEALSSYLAVTSRSVNRVICELREKGILESEKGFIIIKDRQLLRKEAERSRDRRSENEES